MSPEWLWTNRFLAVPQQREDASGQGSGWVWRVGGASGPFARNPGGQWGEPAPTSAVGAGGIPRFSLGLCPGQFPCFVWDNHYLFVKKCFTVAKNVHNLWRLILNGTPVAPTCLRGGETPPPSDHVSVPVRSGGEATVQSLPPDILPSLFLSFYFSVTRKKFVFKNPMTLSRKVWQFTVVLGLNCQKL